MTYSVTPHQLYWCCLSWINSWWTGGSWGDGFAILSVMIKTSIPHSFKHVRVCSVLQRSYWQLHKFLQESDGHLLLSYLIFLAGQCREASTTGSPSVPYYYCWSGTNSSCLIADHSLTQKKMGLKSFKSFKQLPRIHCTVRWAASLLPTKYFKIPGGKDSHGAWCL